MKNAKEIIINHKEQGWLRMEKIDTDYKPRNRNKVLAHDKARTNSRKKSHTKEIYYAKRKKNDSCTT